MVLPPNPELRKRVVKAQRRLNDKRFDEVAELLDPVIAAEPGYAHALYLRGFASEALGHVQRALNDYSKALTLRPRYVEALLARARLALGAHKHAVARHDYSAALAVDEHCFDALLGMGRAHDESGAAGEAISYLARALAERPESVEAALRLAQVQRRSGLVREALAGFQAVVRLDQNHGEAWHELGQCFWELKDAAMALVAFDHAVRCAPTLWGAWRAKAACHAQRREWSQGAAALTRCIEGGVANSSVFAERAVALTRLGADPAAAVSDWRRAVELKPRDAWLRASLAAALKAAQLFDEALAEATASISLNASQPKVWTCRGEVNLKLKRYKEAIEDLSVAISRNSASSSAALYFRALAWVGLENKPQALEDVRAFLKDKPQNKQALELLELLSGGGGGHGGGSDSGNATRGSSTGGSPVK